MESTPLNVLFALSAGVALAAATGFRAFLTYFRQLQEGGLDVDFLAPRLAELTASKVTMFDLSTQAQTTGAATISGEVNAVWGTSFTEDTIAAGLSRGLPAPTSPPPP